MHPEILVLRRCYPVPTTRIAPFGHIIDSRTGVRIREATEREWRDHAQGRDDPAHFHITSDDPLRVMRLVFCDGPRDLVAREQTT